jgi:hypothetical protein
MAALSRCIAVACLALFAVVATGCMISRPCNWDKWRYQSSDGRFGGQDDWDGSPPIILDQQARARPHGDRPDFRLSENGAVLFKAAQHLGNVPAPRVAAHSQKLPAKPTVVQKPMPPAVAPVQWQEPNDTPLPAKKRDPERPPTASAEYAKPTTVPPAAHERQQAQIAAPTDRAPFHWGFFGAETRW